MRWSMRYWRACRCPDRPLTPPPLMAAGHGNQKKPDGAYEAYGVSVTLHELIVLRGRLTGSVQRRLRSRPAARGADLPGARRGTSSGRGLEFAEVRAYQPGDDVRSIDWRHTARRGKPFTKVFQPEHGQAVLLFIDQGASMRFGTRIALKSVQAARVAALLAWAAVDRGDHVGGLVHGQSGSPTPPHPGNRAVLTLLQRISGDPGGGANDGRVSGLPGFAASLTALARMVRPNSEVIVVSDFHGLDQAAEGVLRALSVRARLGLIRVFDPIEAIPPPPAVYRLTDGQVERTLDLRDVSARAAWGVAHSQRTACLEGLAKRLAARLISISTQDDPLQALSICNDRSVF